MICATAPFARAGIKKIDRQGFFKKAFFFEAAAARPASTTTSTSTTPALHAPPAPAAPRPQPRQYSQHSRHCNASHSPASARSNLETRRDFYPALTLKPSLLPPCLQTSCVGAGFLSSPTLKPSLLPPCLQTLWKGKISLQKQRVRQSCGKKYPQLHGS